MLRVPQLQHLLLRLRRRRAAGLGEDTAAGDTAEITDTEAFGAANVDGTGNLTLLQYTQYMGAADGDQVYVNWFNKHDKNGDGIVTADEVRLE
ncbi:hypothetical protein UCDDS831_g05803 [Diplodia seriata]|uniref:EF-hand domain-containing protein n=1 Tax=Diplodia seriata TaxID=420778 RepID=A0A0G2GPN2_9PEZI|nr:hypothetical protein UCDDS831_g05803 [Diplodia seriata]